MQQERSGTPGEMAQQVERAILVMLLVADEQRPWSGALHRAGLIHCCGEFVFATRAAARAQQFAV